VFEVIQINVQLHIVVREGYRMFMGKSDIVSEMYIVRFPVSEHLSRLHMILKPFMLRRIKKDVENELSDKIEIMVYCPLTTRQKLLYSGMY
jgi:SNF2 family DNA or RNA helicase